MNNASPEHIGSSMLRPATVSTAVSARTMTLAVALTLGLMASSMAAFAQSCDKLIGTIDSTKTAKIAHETDQQALQQQIDKIDNSEQAFRQKLQSGDCRPEGADTAATDDKRPSCKALLQVILDAAKIRDSLKRQIDTLKTMADDATGDEEKLVQLAKAGGCPPYASKQEAATTKDQKPGPDKKASKKSDGKQARSKRRSRGRYANEYRRRGAYGPPPHGPPPPGPMIGIGGGGIGIGVGF
jgi:hypothetical protein